MAASVGGSGADAAMQTIARVHEDDRDLPARYRSTGEAQKTEGMCVFCVAVGLLVLNCLVVLLRIPGGGGDFGTLVGATPGNTPSCHKTCVKM